MPYKRIGKTVYKKVGKRWKKKGSSKTIRKAKAYLRVLQGIHRGWRPTRRKR